MPIDAVTPAVIRLVDPSGSDREVTPHDVAAALEAGGFFWLDLEAADDGDLVELHEVLGLPADTTLSTKQDGRRSAFGRHAGCVLAVLPAAVEKEATVWLEASYVTVVLTDRFLLTAHPARCAALELVRKHYLELEDHEARSDEALVLFLVLDILLDSFRPQLLALDDRLGEIQLGMLEGAPTAVHDELVQILGILTDGIQELGWYVHDLDEIAGTVDRLPGFGPGSPQHFARHRLRVTRMRANGREIREEAKDALRQYSEAVAGRQARVLSSLTVVATVFLPLSFLTGYFGMNFQVLTTRVQTQLWQFLLLGLLLPVTSAALSLLLIRRLERRFGLAGRKRRPG